VTLNELRYIVALARERHFGRAAEACYVSQPTLSVAVKKLEQELGSVLFERGKHEVSITPVGQRIVEHAQRVLDEIEDIRETARHQGDQLRGTLRLGAIYTVGPYLFPHMVPALHETAPDMALILEENYTAVLARRLQLGELDAILVSLPFEENGVVALPLYEEPFVVVMPAAHPWRSRERIAPAELAAERLLLLGAGHCFRDQVLIACPECNRPAGHDHADLVRAVEGSSLETIRHMVASGMGVTVLPCSAAGAAQYTHRLLAIRRFEPPPPTRQVALAWRATFPRPKAIEAVRQAILAHPMSCVRPL
jgi:LysR family transcriptional regulator, hydrogen peroxide-inducible genes activator